MTKDSHKILISTTLFLWFAMMLAPAVMADEVWQKIERPGLDFVYSNSAVTGKEYGNVVLDSVSVWFPETALTAANDAETLRIQSERLLRTTFTSSGLNLVAGTSKEAIALRIQLIDLRAYSTDDAAPDWAENYGFHVMPGRVTMVAELFDAASGTALVRMADLQDKMSNGKVPALNVDLALEEWGYLIAASIRGLPSNTQMAGLATR